MYLLDVPSRKALILNKFEDKFNIPLIDLDPLQRSQMLGEVFNEVLPSFITNKVDKSYDLENLFNEFTNNITPILELTKQMDMAKQKNIYQMFKAASLSASNAVTRTLNTKLGLFWEDVANLSKNVISLEKEFGIKLPGVDAVVFHNERLFYTQLKTQKNTLTGSQSGRVNGELGCFENSWFVACINNNASWTYSGRIPKLVGDDFWSKTTLDYNEILYHLERTINHVEDLVTN
ncbi:hypothetical protein COC52_24865 [Priestia megaterium]|uniref:hypothetical protein n=1 Tax=Priestia megaterium TaxID=1404 RepID=UPI000BFB8009|nr:hypothetical protein [Priestia megaterium]PGR23029.1 hypothetical protein COC52_24865 [Priestia megaterium]